MRPTNLLLLLLLLLHYKYYGRHRDGYLNTHSKRRRYREIINAGWTQNNWGDGVSASTSIKRLKRFACFYTAVNSTLVNFIIQCGAKKRPETDFPLFRNKNKKTRTAQTHDKAADAEEFLLLALRRSGKTPLKVPWLLTYLFTYLLTHW